MDLSVDKSPTNQSSVAPAYSETSKTYCPNHQPSQPNSDKCKICEKSPEALPLKLDLSNYVRTILSFEKQINCIKLSWASPIMFWWSQVPQKYSQCTWVSPFMFSSSQVPQTYSQGTWASPIMFWLSQVPQKYSQGTAASPITFWSLQVPQKYSQGTWASPITFSSSQVPKTYS